MTETKKRHGCLTTWLVLMIVFNALGAAANLAGGEAVQGQFPDAPGWAFPVLGLLGIVNIACAIALFRWKKWGFLGFCATSIAAVIINLSIGLAMGAVLGGLLGVAVLYGVLQIGGDKKAWPRLD